MQLYTKAIEGGSEFFFSSTKHKENENYMSTEDNASIKIGAYLIDTHGTAHFQVLGKYYAQGAETICGFVLVCKALCDIPEGEKTYRVEYKGYSIAWITLSDSGSVGKRKDESGPCIGTKVRECMEVSIERGFILPDNPFRLEHLLLELALLQQYNCIFTTGGTGLSPRDTTPEVMEKILHRSLHGFEIAMMQESMKHVSTAILSRAKAGVIAQSIIINLPGSPKAVAQNIQAILPALQHGIDKLCGDPSDCANIYALSK